MRSVVLESIVAVVEASIDKILLNEEKSRRVLELYLPHGASEGTKPQLGVVVPVQWPPPLKI